MQHRDMKWANAVGKMVRIDLFDAGLPQTFNLWKNAIKWGLLVYFLDDNAPTLPPSSLTVSAPQELLWLDRLPNIFLSNIYFLDAWVWFLLVHPRQYLLNIFNWACRQHLTNKQNFTCLHSLLYYSLSVNFLEILALYGQSYCSILLFVYICFWIFISVLVISYKRLRLGILSLIVFILEPQCIHFGSEDNV